MAKPAHYTSKVAIPLPSDEAVRRIIGNSYNPEKTLNVIKMFAGTEDMFEGRSSSALFLSVIGSIVTMAGFIALTH